MAASHKRSQILNRPSGNLAGTGLGMIRGSSNLERSAKPQGSRNAAERFARHKKNNSKAICAKSAIVVLLNSRLCKSGNLARKSKEPSVEDPVG